MRKPAPSTEIAEPNKGPLTATRNSPPDPELLVIAKRYGTHSNSFLVLYSGYRYFRSSEPNSEGCIAYVETKHAMVGAAEPLAPAVETVRLLSSFSAFAQKAGKVAMLLPVSEAITIEAAKAGYGALQIGTEPFFSLKSYKLSLDQIPTAKRLAGKGAEVSAFRPETLSREALADYDDVVRDWFTTRKMADLGFLNRAEPWSLAEHKKYFHVALRGKILAFVAAAPIPARNGWYLIDIFRRHDSPPGSTELLILQALRVLKDEGYEEISLGMAPLAGLETPSQNSHPMLLRVLGEMYKHGELFYNFRSLYRFKEKFSPSRREHAFLIFSPDKIGVKNALGIVEASLGSWQRAFFSGTSRWLLRFEPMRFFSAFLSKKIVFRPSSTAIRRSLFRYPATLLLLLTSLLSFEFYNAGPAAVLSSYFTHLPMATAAVPHSEVLSTLRRMVSIVLLCGGLETIGGTLFVAIGFFSACAAGVLAVELQPLLQLATSYFEVELPQIENLPRTVAVFGMAGSWCAFLRYGTRILTALCSVAILSAGFSGNTGKLSYLVAAISAYFAAQWVLRRKDLF